MRSRRRSGLEGVRVLSAGDGGSGSRGSVVVSHAVSHALGPAEQSLLEGLQAAAFSSGGYISPAEFPALRPLFEQTAEQLERIAGERGWLRLQARAVSNAWTGVGVALLAGAVVLLFARQPVAAICVACAGLRIVPGARRMPLPLRTADGIMTFAMVEAYRRTLRRALAGDPGTVPPWLANAEEAALWGYAWGLEGEVQAFVGRNVGAAMQGSAVATSGDMDSIVLLLQGPANSPSGTPMGLDIDAIATTLNGLGRSLALRSGEASPSES